MAAISIQMPPSAQLPLVFTFSNRVLAEKGPGSKLAKASQTASKRVIFPFHPFQASTRSLCLRPFLDQVRVHPF